MLIKVCGLRESENCLEVDLLQPNMMGFIFYNKSPRFIGESITPSTKAKKVGVFVNNEEHFILKMIEKHQLSYVQLHGDESINLAKSLHQKGIKTIKCFAIEDELNLEKMAQWEPFCTYFLFDTKGKYLGGNGKKFNWDLLQNYQLKTPFLLSGGIELNDIDAIKKINQPAFAGIDVNSKFELTPGLKNIPQLKLFIDAIKK